MPRALQSRALITRHRLLAATVEALVECGYAGATTQEVCRRAGASRGTLLHHFKTRIELLLAALESILADRVEAFVAAHAAEPLDAAQLVDLMWAEWQGPALRAWLELAVAARTNDALRAPMRVVMLDFEARVHAAFEAILGPEGLPPMFREGAPMLLFALLNGLAVGQSYEDEGHALPVLNLMKQLAETLLGGSSRARPAHEVMK